MVPLILKQWTLTYGTLKIFIKKGKPHTYFCFAFLKKNKDFVTPCLSWLSWCRGEAGAGEHDSGQHLREPPRQHRHQHHAH